MFKFDNPHIRYIGRWHFGNAAASTANGSSFEFAVDGDFAVLRFDISKNKQPFPHIWVVTDGSCRTEVPLDAFIRLEFEKGGRHTVKVILKSCLGLQNRWCEPLETQVAFLGFEAPALAELTPCGKKTIEFIGDSITEGAFVDDGQRFFEAEADNSCYLADSTASYAYLTAAKLNLDAIITAYAGQGVSNEGCGGVPKAAEAYSFCFENAPYNAKSADYIVINEGTNDAHRADEFAENYESLLNTVYERNPHSAIAVMVPFSEVFKEEIKAIVNRFNDAHGTDIFYIDTSGWLPKEPIHPTRSSHILAAEKLTAVLKEHYNI